MARVKGHRFDAFDKPVPRHTARPGTFDEQENETVLEHGSVVSHKGKFF